MIANQHILDTLTKLAAANDAAGNMKFSAAIVRRNRVVSFGFNSMKSHPFQARYGRNSDSIFPHAEISAIKNALKIITVDDLLKCELYIVRVKRPSRRATNYVWGNAKPCEGCTRAILEFGIKRVIYSTDEHNKWEVMKC